MTESDHEDRLARCYVCGVLLEWPDAVDLNGDHYPVRTFVAMRNNLGFYHADCAPPDGS